jgi:hypothetical protein
MRGPGEFAMFTCERLKACCSTQPAAESLLPLSRSRETEAIGSRTATAPVTYADVPPGLIARERRFSGRSDEAGT